MAPKNVSTSPSSSRSRSPTLAPLSPHTQVTFAIPGPRIRIFQTSNRKLALLYSYAPDWLLTILLTGLFYLLEPISGFKREFDLNDTSIQHTFAVHERVPPWLLYTLAVGAPAILMPVINLIMYRRWWDLHTSYLGLLLALALTGSITQVVKVTVGRPRPDLISRCLPSPDAKNNPIFGLTTVNVCTTAATNWRRLNDGFRSFPSGHSSLSFSGLGFLSFYLAGKLHLWDKGGYTGKAWLSLAPLLGAALVAISRTMDYRHHWQDVLVGSALGLSLAFFSYRQYYRPLSHPNSHVPYIPRIDEPDARVTRFAQGRGRQPDLENGRVDEGAAAADTNPSTYGMAFPNESVDVVATGRPNVS